jgi:hypothetical protein
VSVLFPLKKELTPIVPSLKKELTPIVPLLIMPFIDCKNPNGHVQSPVEDFDETHRSTQAGRTGSERCNSDVSRRGGAGATDAARRRAG